jgi:hypothetical protein
VLLSMVRPSEGYTQDRIRRMFGAYETDIQFPTFIPVHLTYQTAFVDDQGKLEFRDDIYGRDQALVAILNGTERKVADIPIQRKDSTMRRQLLAMPDNFWGRLGTRLRRRIELLHAIVWWPVHPDGAGPASTRGATQGVLSVMPDRR